MIKIIGFSLNEIWSILHGVGFGAALLLLFPLVLVGLFFLRTEWVSAGIVGLYVRLLKLGVWLLAICSWLTVIVGSYFPYVWYRATPPKGADLSGFPKGYLMSNPDLSFWHTFGMEWKEHLGWMVPILCTAAAMVISCYGSRLLEDRKLRRMIITILIIAFVAGGITGFLGVLITKLAPVR